MRHFGYFDPSKSRIRIIQDEELSDIAIHQCLQCEERSCLKTCPAGALRVHPHYGCIVHDREVCRQCRKCQQACAHHGVFWDEENNFPLICDLCDGDPECVKPCKLHEALSMIPQEELLPDFFLTRYLGGRGAAAGLLWERTGPKTKPLGRGNLLIFSPGALTGTTAPASGRTTVTFRSPATGGKTLQFCLDHGNVL